MKCKYKQGIEYFNQVQLCEFLKCLTVKHFIRSMSTESPITSTTLSSCHSTKRSTTNCQQSPLRPIPRSRLTAAKSKLVTSFLVFFARNVQTNLTGYSLIKYLKKKQFCNLQNIISRHVCHRQLFCIFELRHFLSVFRKWQPSLKICFC